MTYAELAKQIEKLDQPICSMIIATVAGDCRNYAHTPCSDEDFNYVCEYIYQLYCHANVNQSLPLLCDIVMDLVFDCGYHWREDFEPEEDCDEEPQLLTMDNIKMNEKRDMVYNIHDNELFNQ